MNETIMRAGFNHETGRATTDWITKHRGFTITLTLKGDTTEFLEHFIKRDSDGFTLAAGHQKLSLYGNSIPRAIDEMKARIDGQLDAMDLTMEIAMAVDEKTIPDLPRWTTLPRCEHGLAQVTCSSCDDAGPWDQLTDSALSAGPHRFRTMQAEIDDAMAAVSADLNRQLFQPGPKYVRPTLWERIKKNPRYNLTMPIWFTLGLVVWGTSALSWVAFNLAQLVRGTSTVSWNDWNDL
jgi:hypothetical protein